MSEIPNGKLPELWIFVDESGDPSVLAKMGDSQFFHVGMVTLLSCPGQHLVDSAIADLRNDPDALKNKKDQKCLVRGYFHASVDSKNAHSHWCRAINSLSPLDFEFFTFDKQEIIGGKSLFSSDGVFHRHMIELLATKTTGQRVIRVTLRIAARGGSFPSGIEKEWMRQFIEKVTLSAAEIPHIPTFFPNLEVIVVQGKEPGVQIADFLLWAALRKWGPNPVTGCKWADYVGLTNKAAWRQIEGPLGAKEFYINAPIPVYSELLIDVENIKAPEDAPSLECMARYFAYAEANIQHLAQNGLPLHANHMETEVEDLAKILKRSKISGYDVHKLCEVSLRLIDTVPLYNPKNMQDTHFVIDAKKIFGIVYMRKEIRWFGITTWWKDVREKIAQERPALIGWDR
jgi:hypothetical protein